MVEMPLLPQLPAREACSASLAHPGVAPLEMAGVHSCLSSCIPEELLTDRITLQLLGGVWVHTWMWEV